VNAISIRERPAEAEDRAIPGQWEGDLLSGAKNSYIATLVERHSRFAMLIKVPSKDTEAVVAALSRKVLLGQFHSSDYGVYQAPLASQCLTSHRGRILSARSKPAWLV